MGKGSGGMSGTQKGILKREYGLKRDAESYIRELEQQPLEVRGNALGQLAGLYGGGPESQGIQQGMINQAQNSPLYGSIMGNWDNSRREGEESIMRNASMTGGMRSGNVQDAMYRYNAEGQNQAQNQALLQSYNQQLMGMQGLSQVQGMPTQLAGLMGGSVNLGGALRGTSSESAWMQGIGGILGGGADGASKKT